MATDLHQQTLPGMQYAHDYYPTRQIAELYHVTTNMIIRWIKSGWLNATMPCPQKKDAKTDRSRYRVHPQQIEEIERRRDELGVCPQLEQKVGIGT